LAAYSVNLNALGGSYLNINPNEEKIIMKVLVSDNLGEAGIRMFQEEKEIQVDVKTGLAPEALKSIIKEYDALVIRSASNRRSFGCCNAP